MNRIGRTNQAVYFCRQTLSLTEGLSGQARQQHEEAALFHLYSAAFALVQELQAQYGLAPVSSLEELKLQDDLPAELYELSLLLSGDSWLASLHRLYCRSLSQGLSERSGVHNGLITSQSDYQSLIANWLIELEKTVHRMREHYQEN